MASIDHLRSLFARAVVDWAGPSPERTAWTDAWTEALLAAERRNWCVCAGALERAQTIAEDAGGGELDLEALELVMARVA